jgi:sugar/nucleoside kinase (ribokinase family)
MMTIMNENRVDREQSHHDVLVAGHICLDLIPRLPELAAPEARLFYPGRLVPVGPVTAALGGSVANVGLALHRLGMSTRLVGRVGDDFVGQTITRLLEEVDERLGAGLIVAPGEASSYTIVLSPPGLDRGFLHFTGTNDTFRPADVDLSPAAARLLHFGYPPLMRSVYRDRGVGLAELFAQARGRGMLVSLDMAMPDVNSEAGRVDWREFCHEVLPLVDVFMPSFDELLLMLMPTRFHELRSVRGPHEAVLPGSIELVEELADEAICLGVKIACLKLGDHGCYLRTADDLDELAHRGSWATVDWSGWAGRQLYATCHTVDVVGTNGAGDCTVAGFLTALLRGLAPQEAIDLGTAVGACCVESADATSGVLAWSSMRQRLQRGWPRHAPRWPCDDWQPDPLQGIWCGPRDAPD